jgi:hypothetical protein
LQPADNKQTAGTTTEIGAERGKKDAKIKSFFNNSFDEVTKFYQRRFSLVQHTSNFQKESFRYPFKATQVQGKHFLHQLALGEIATRHRLLQFPLGRIFDREVEAILVATASKLPAARFACPDGDGLFLFWSSFVFPKIIVITQVLQFLL